MGLRKAFRRGRMSSSVEFYDILTIEVENTFVENLWSS